MFASGGEPSFKTMSKTTMRMGALFISIARESLELSYQDTEPYVVDADAEQSSPLPPIEPSARAR